MLSNELLNKEISPNVLRAMRQVVPNIYDELKGNEDYKEIDKKYSRIMDTLRERLNQKEFYELDELLGSKEEIELDTMYYRGMTDAIQLLKLLKVI